MSFEGSKAVIIKDLSGNVLNIPNGSLQATANVSGNAINVVSGAVAITDDGGATITFVGNPSFDNTTPSAIQTLYTHTYLSAYDQTADRMNRLRITASGNVASQGGSQFRLLTDTTQAGSNLKTAGIVAISDASGGAALAASGVTIHGIDIKFVSGAVNAALHIGSSGNPPYISGGYVMDVGESKHFNVYNPAFIRVFARTSGSIVSWAGVNF